MKKEKNEQHKGHSQGFLASFHHTHADTVLASAGGEVAISRRASEAIKTRKRKRAMTAYILIIPAFLLFAIYTVIPFVMSFVFSFTDFNGVSINNWVGWSNFITAFNDSSFMGTIQHVFVFALFYVPTSIIVSLVISFMVSQAKRFQTFFKILFYIPSLTSGVAMAYVWQRMLSSLTQSGLPNFLDSKVYSMMSLVAISVWSAIGGNMLIYLAAMTGIPKDVYEASSIDGASKWQQFFHITIPLLRPTTYFIFTTTLIGSFQLFDLVYLIFGNENHFVDTPVMDIYLYGKSFKYGIGSAMSVILFFIIMIVTVILQLFIKEDKGDGRPRHAKKTN